MFWDEKQAMQEILASSIRQERTARFAAARLYPVISSEFCSGRSPLDVFAAAVAGGAKVIQLREKHWDKGRICELARACRPVADSHGVLIIIDDYADVAVEAGADGVHIGQDDMSVAEVRALSPDLLVGKSTHNLEELLAAQEEGTDYLNIGPIFATNTKSVSYPAVGLETLTSLIPHVKIPFSVMGGIKKRHIKDLLAAGARRIAMVTEITQDPDVEAKVRELEALFPPSW
jgi:thiamine-phosphate pyrophosphorylase